MLCGMMYLPVCIIDTPGNLAREKRTYWAMMALKRARFTTMFGFALRHIFTISDPMFSPSLSQSVQIMS
jgi:hypothetical protein